MVQLRTLFAALVTALVLTACGGGDKPADTKPAADAAPAQQAPAAQAPAADAAPAAPATEQKPQ